MGDEIPKALTGAPALTRRLYAHNVFAGLRDSGLQILVLLARSHEPMRAKTIGERLALEQSRTSHLLKGLADAGLVSWVADERYSRRRSYSLTEAGGRTVSEFVRRAAPELDQMSDDADVFSQGVPSSGPGRSGRRSGG